MKKIAIAIIPAVTLMFVTSPANAAPSYAKLAKCPDVREDVRDRIESRRDERVNHGPLDRLEDRIDRRESRRDEKVDVCPRVSYKKFR